MAISYIDLLSLLFWKYDTIVVYVMLCKCVYNFAFSSILVKCNEYM
jgi:hypothetical protein